MIVSQVGSVEMMTRVYVHRVTGIEHVWISRMD
jgi:hypothetical protein